MDNAQVTLPDDGGSIENEHKWDTPSRNAWCHKVKIGNLTSRDRTDASENLTEDHQPQGRLNSAGDNVRWIMAQLAYLPLRNIQRLDEEVRKRRESVWARSGKHASRGAGLCGGFLKFHDNCLQIPGHRLHNEQTHHSVSSLDRQRRP